MVTDEKDKTRKLDVDKRRGKDRKKVEEEEDVDTARESDDMRGDQEPMQPVLNFDTNTTDRDH